MAEGKITGEKILFGKPSYTEEEELALKRVLYSGWTGLGPETEAFEHELAQYLGSKKVITVDSCTSALFLALRISGVGAGDEVLVPSFTWCATANAAIFCGATPVFCDVDPQTFCISISDVVTRITPKTKAVIVVHYGGYPADVFELKKNLPANIAVIEDAAHAFGAIYPNGKKVGNSGNLTCFSFYSNKNLATGEGGAISLNNEELALRIKKLRQNGMPVSSWQQITGIKTGLPQPEELGYKMNYIDLHACIGRVQLKRFDQMQKTRAAIVDIYRKALLKHFPDIRIQLHVESAAHAKHLFVILLPHNKPVTSRNQLLMKLRERDIGASVHYMPLHMMEYYKNSFGVTSLPVCEHLFHYVLSLPLSASMSLGQAEYVAQTLTQLI